MPQGVKCSVSNCDFWKQGNDCTASAIMVDIDQNAQVNYTEEFGDIGVSTDRKELADSSSGTCCHTFRPKSGL